MVASSLLLVMTPDGHAPQSLEALLASQDWPRLRAQWLRFACYVSRSKQRAPDLVHEAVARALDPNDDPWRPEVEPDFARHVMRIIANINRVEKDTEYRQRDPRYAATILERMTTIPKAPDDELLAAESDARAERLLATLRERLADDALALQIVDLASDGDFTRPADQVLATGHPIEEIRNARKRVSRALDAIVLEDERATETLERQAAP